MFAVDAALVAQTDGLRVRIDGSGSVLTCRLDGGALHVWRALRRRRGFLSVARALGPLLVRSGLRLDVFAGRVRLGQIGSGVVANGPARLLRLPATRVGR